MKKYILYGAGKLGKKAYEELGKERIDCFIDKDRAGEEYCGIRVISLEDYLDEKKKEEIVICIQNFKEITNLLLTKGITNFQIYRKVFMLDDVPLSKSISHLKWIDRLVELADFEGKEVLEIGSRVVTGSVFRDKFKHANYTGFDLYEGENVDVVGDAHMLSKYFNKKFDLIFSSAVFEHFSMPWLVADEMIKLLKVGGYVFTETHYSYSSHERPWHFFQFSEQALKVLFSEKRGIQCIEAGVSNPIVGYFSEEADEYLRGRTVPGLYCHSEFLGKKINEQIDLSWKNNMEIESLGMYPRKDSQ